MGIAHGRADILVAEQFLDFPQILSHLVEEDRGRGVAQPMRGDLPYPEGSTGGPQPQIERPVGKRRARISCKHKLRRREVDPAGSHDPSAFKFLLEGLPLEERRTQAPGNGHILGDGIRERKTPGIEIRGSRPAKKSCPGALIRDTSRRGILRTLRSTEDPFWYYGGVEIRL